ncbi:hypothetical protein [Massilia sp. BKSP1R2A-1]|jgi:protein TonB|uniref:hypothetical protein n=1 Tax=Massilia sp. BKSP1R2A-1 TaxID=3422595 RepID=UPI003D35524C
METTYDFLELLELDESASASDIRRAYARKLKRIDQEADADGFQALRNAYEVALDWARWKLAQDAPQPEAPPAAVPVAAEDALPEEQQASQEDEPPEAVRLGGEVFGRLGESAKALAAADKLGDVAAWRAAIEARFADEELVNIDARIYFEAYVASMLANGWRPGHEALFVAAKDAFAWDGDRRRLWQLGQAGRFLDQAIEERHVFDALPAEEQVRMRELARMLRQSDIPATRRVQAAMPDTERMLARFPALMAVVADMENAERWRSAYREAGGAPIAFDVQEPLLQAAEPKRTFTTWQGIVLFLVLSAVLRAVFNHSGGEQESGRGFIPPASQQAPAPRSTPAVPQAVLDRVVPPLRYTPPPGARSGKLEVVYKVFLTEDRKVERVQNWQTSGEPGFDAAVGLALRNAAAFPPATPRQFDVRYTADIAGADKRTTPPGPVTIPVETLRAHIPPVQFHPARSAREGKYTGRYRAMLDAGGRVKEVQVIASSGNLLLDMAVEKAVLDAKPFPGGLQSFEFTYSSSVVRKQRDSEQEPEQDAPDDPPAE